MTYNFYYYYYHRYYCLVNYFYRFIAIMLFLLLQLNIKIITFFLLLLLIIIFIIIMTIMMLIKFFGGLYYYYLHCFISNLIRYEEKTERPAEHAMLSLVPEALAHLGEADLSYFLHWVLCMGVESQESGRKQLQHIWGSSSLQR